MKILEVVASLGIGGTERTAENFSLGLKSRGHDVRVFALNGGIRQESLQQNNIPLYFTINEVKEISSSWLPSVIHIHTHGISKEVQENICDIFPNAQVCEQNVFSVPSDYSKLDYSFQLSTWCTWNYLNRKQSYSHRIHILPNPINPANFYPISSSERADFRNHYHIPLNAIVLLRIGQPIIAKWNIRMIDVFVAIKKKFDNVYLFCVGAPQNVIAYSHKFKTIGGNIIFVDRFENDADLRRCYGASDIFFHMARIGESFGIVLTEAMLCGLPIVTVNTPYCDNSQSEVVGHMKGGIVANRYKGIVAAIEILIKDQTLREGLCLTGREAVLSRYAINNVLDKFEQIVSKKLKINPPHHLIYISKC